MKMMNNYISIEPLNYNYADELYYRNQLESLINEMVNEVEKNVIKLFNNYLIIGNYANDSKKDKNKNNIVDKIKFLLDFLYKKNLITFATQSAILSKKIIKNVSITSLHNFQNSIRGLFSKIKNKNIINPNNFFNFIAKNKIGFEINDITKALIEENILLIKSIPEKYFFDIRQAVFDVLINGKGVNELIAYFEKYKNITKKRARLIAGDQIRKAYTALIKAKMIEHGLDKFQWIYTYESITPRKLHIKLNNTICSISDPPIIENKNNKIIKGLPGQLINCKCKMRPVIRIGEYI